jgi:hypothetical protein
MYINCFYRLEHVDDTSEVQNCLSDENDESSDEEDIEETEDERGTYGGMSFNIVGYCYF